VARLLAQAERGGVLAPWDFGHLIQWQARMPTVCDGFFGAPAHDEALRACLRMTYETEPARAEQLLLRYRVRYLVILPPHPAQVRSEARILGIDPARFLSSGDRFTRAFATTAWARLGLWAAGAREGDSGPLGVRLRHRVIVTDPQSGQALQEALVLERVGGS
jgi:hypothetical protein